MSKKQRDQKVQREKLQPKKLRVPTLQLNVRVKEKTIANLEKLSQDSGSTYVDIVEMLVDEAAAKVGKRNSL